MKEDVEVPFSSFPGYKNVRTRSDKHGMTVTFVEFETIDEATVARDSLSGVLRLRPTDPPVSIYFARHSHGSEGEGAKRPREDSGPDDRSVRARQPDLKCHACGGMGHFARDCPTSSGRGPPPPRSSAGGSSYQGAPTSTLYVDNVPPEASEREMAHVFRPFPGFQDVRHVPLKKTGSDAKTFLCFVEFAAPENAQQAMQTLQGYVLDLKDPRSPSLKIEFTKTVHKTQGRPPASMGSAYGGGASFGAPPAQAYQPMGGPMPVYSGGGGMGGYAPPPSYGSMGGYAPGPPMGGYRR